MNAQINYYLQITNKTFSVNAFTSTDNKLSSDFTYHLWLDNNVQLPNLLGKSARLICNNKYFIEGLISEQINQDQLILSSPLVNWKLQIRSRTFIQQTALEIIETLLIECGWSANQFKIITQKQYPKLELVIQYQQSNYDLLCQLCREHGLMFAFVHHNNQQRLMIIDDPQQLLSQGSRRHQLAFNPTAGMIPGKSSIIALEIHKQLVGKEILTVNAVTDALGIYPGDQVTVSDYPIAEINKTYTVVACQDSLKSTYVNQLVLMPNVTNIPVKANQCKYNYHCANIESGLDSAGRYHLRFSFDEAQHPRGAASSWIGCMQPYTGSRYGWHFPLRQHSKVIIHYSDTLAKKPVIQGTVHNQLQRCIIHTQQHNHLVFNDTQAQAGIHWQSQHKNQMISLIDNTNKKTITILAKKGEINLSAEKSFEIKCADKLLFTAKRHYHVVVKHNVTTRIHKGYCHFISGKHFIQVAAENVVIQADRHLHCRAHQDINLQACDIFVNAIKNHCYFNSKKDINLNSRNLAIKLAGARGSLIISQGRGKIEITANGSIMVTAPRITFRAQQFVSKASKVAI